LEAIFFFERRVASCHRCSTRMGRKAGRFDDESH
jgi:hypothetical protein